MSSIFFTTYNAYSAVSGGPFLPLSGGTMTGDINIPNNGIRLNNGMLSYGITGSVITGPSLFSQASNVVPAIGVSGFRFEPANADITLGNRLAGISTPIYNHDAANKAYVDSHASTPKLILSETSTTNVVAKFGGFSFEYDKPIFASVEITDSNNVTSVTNETYFLSSSLSTSAVKMSIITTSTTGTINSYLMCFVSKSGINMTYSKSDITGMRIYVYQ